MSSVGQAAGGVVGAVAGFFVGGPKGALYGAQIGMSIGGYIDPPKGPKQELPATKDLTVQTATYGALRPRMYGTIPVFANIFWLENNLIKMVVKKTKQGGGKGGSKKTTVKTKTYYGTFAAGLCDCPSSPIVGIKRIWLGGKLWYDAGSSDQDSIRASNDASTLFTLHKGSDTQLADDRMQATLGIANTPAYRGLAYIVFKDLPLAPYGDTLMGLQIKVEVVCSGTVSSYAGTRYITPPVQLHNVVWGRDKFVGFTTGYPNRCFSSPDGATWIERTLPTITSGTIDVQSDNLIYASGLFIAGAKSNIHQYYSRDGIFWEVTTLPSSSVWTSIATDGEIILRASDTGNYAYSIDGKSWITTATKPVGSGYWHLKYFAGLFITFGATATDYATSEDGFIWTMRTFPATPSIDFFVNNDQYMLFSDAVDNIWRTTDGIYWTNVGSLSSNSAGAIWDGENFVAATTDPDNYYTSPDGSTWTARAYPARQSTFDFAYNDAVLVAVGLHFDFPYEAFVTVITKNQLASSDVSLANIVSSEVLQSNIISAGDIDVTLLASQTVRGYKVSNVAAIRSALEPLQGAWPFDVVHHGYTLQFKPRGTTSVVTIPEDDLDARNGGDAPGVALTSVREMDSMLPRRVVITSLDYNREYDANVQSDERLNTDSVNTLSLDLAIVFTADECKQRAVILLYMYWMERYSLKFSIHAAKYNNLEPGDVVTVVTSTGSYVLRITQITYTADGLLDCDAKYSRSATYTSTAVGGTPAAVTVTLALPGDSAMELLDIPLLDDSMNQAGFVAAMTGYSSGWTGGEIYRTDDGGASWSDLQAFAAPGSSIGYAVNAIGAGRTDIFDNSNVLQAYFIHGSFSSVTELAVLNGSNYFAYGVHGRWEIIAAKTCVLQADGSYKFSDLLRGCNGTEWACGLHAAGDTVVALDNSSVIFVGASTSAIGLSRVYRGVTEGQEISAVSDYNFTYSGVNLECYAPVYLNGSRHPSTNDWTLTWVPRTRVGGEWRDAVDATMAEASEFYVIEIYSDGTYTTLKRTLTASTPTVTYLSTGTISQTTDFGSNQATLYLKIYQVSAVVGNGYPLTSSITR